MAVLMLLSSIILISSQNVFMKEFNTRFKKNDACYFVYLILFQLVSIGIYIFALDQVKLDATTVIYGVISGVIYSVAFLLYSKSLEMGPYALSSLLFSLGLVVPIFYGTFFLQEQLNLFQIIGFALLFITLYITSKSNGSDDKKATKKWLFVCVAALCGGGLLMTLSKAQQVSTPGQNMSEFMIAMFATSAIFSAILLVIRLKKHGDIVDGLKDKRFLGLVLINGVTAGVSSLIGMKISNVTPATVQFPVVNGGIVIVSTLVAIFLYKEKMTKIRVFALLIGLLSVIFMCIV